MNPGLDHGVRELGTTGRDYPRFPGHRTRDPLVSATLW